MVSLVFVLGEYAFSLNAHDKKSGLLLVSVTTWKQYSILPVILIACCRTREQ